MAADTQLTGDYRYRVQKIVGLPDGGIAGGAGIWSRAYAGLSWLASGEVTEPPKIKGATILILRPDGSLWIAEGDWPAYPLLDKQAAIGCGCQAAMQAMVDGSSPGEAIKKVCKLDAFTGEPVQVLSLEPKRGKRSRNAR
jgi:hypothetical protein